MSRSCGDQFGAMSERSAAISVLVVDDDPTMILLLEAVFARLGNGFSVVGSATGGYEGLRLWHQLRPDVVVLDLSMPDLDGLDVAEEIQSSNPGQAIVLFSAHIDTTTATDVALSVSKKEATQLPELIDQWMSSRNDPAWATSDSSRGAAGE